MGIAHTPPDLMSAGDFYFFFLLLYALHIWLMNYKTVETIIIPIYPEHVKYAAEFAAVGREIRYIKEKLGNDFISEDDITPMTTVCDCPYCGKERLLFITGITRSADNTRRMLDAKCVCCTKRVLVYQEICDE